MRPCATRRDVLGLIIGGVLLKFSIQSALTSAVVSTQPLTDVSTKQFSWGKVQPAFRADNFAVLVVPNVNVRVQAQHSIPL